MKKIELELRSVDLDAVAGKLAAAGVDAVKFMDFSPGAGNGQVCGYFDSVRAEIYLTDEEAGSAVPLIAEACASFPGGGDIAVMSLEEKIHIRNRNTVYNTNYKEVRHV